MASSERPEAPVLVPVLGYRYALKLQHLAITIAFGCLFLLLNILPLRNTDLWGHVLYGQWILEHHTLPTSDPFQPLAAGMRSIDTAWLSQVTFAWVDKIAGGKGLSILFALVVWSSYIILCRAWLRQSHSLLAMSIGLIVALGVGWSRLTTIRPEIFSLLCLAILLWLLARQDHPRSTTDSLSSDDQARSAPPGKWLWCAVPVLFAIWANLHDTFIGGCLILFCYAVGRFIDAWIDTRSFRAAVGGRAFHSWLLLAELAVAATLINPYGLDLWLEVFQLGANPILRDLPEWTSMVMLGLGGREFVAGCVMLFAALRISRRRLYAHESLLLLTFGLFALLQIRMIGWLAPIMAFVLVPHVAQITTRIWPARNDEAALAASLPVGELPPGRSFRYTLICLTFAWIFFAFSGLGEYVLGSTPRSDKSLYGEAPLELTEYLRKSPPQGQVFNPQWWGDWLLAKGPAGFKPFVTANLQLVPRQVWIDYRRIQSAEGAIESVLDRYRIATVIVDKQLQPVLAGAMLRLPGWGIAHEDEQSAVYRRLRRKSDGESKPAATAPVANDESPSATTPVATPNKSLDNSK